ncbi:MAG: AAA family ATPase [Candidatus Jordarchaeum sp.]|uniref:AAA family ATPase n=1 Tax=Candidatus Jordarchaeum sp. TaxID=2823881 RepID=UPI00404A5B67
MAGQIPKEFLEYPNKLKPKDIEESLVRVGYLPNQKIVTTLFLAFQLDKPILVEGAAGIGKTYLGVCTAKLFGFPLIRLQCYEGILPEQSIYEWNYHKQLLKIQMNHLRDNDGCEKSIFSEEYLLERPLLTALKSPQAVLLIDEIDKADEQFEAFLLELLGERQITIPELGTVQAPENQKLITVLTSNSSRELSEPLKRRCLHLFLEYPPKELEKRIILLNCPQMYDEFVDNILDFLENLRSLRLQKIPSIAESIDFARSLLVIGKSDLDPETVNSLLSTLLKIKSDVDIVKRKGIENLLGTGNDGH